MIRVRGHSSEVGTVLGDTSRGVVWGCEGGERPSGRSCLDPRWRPPPQPPLCLQQWREPHCRGGAKLGHRGPAPFPASGDCGAGRSQLELSALFSPLLLCQRHPALLPLRPISASRPRSAPTWGGHGFLMNINVTLPNQGSGARRRGVPLPRNRAGSRLHIYERGGVGGDIYKQRLRPPRRTSRWGLEVLSGSRPRRYR